MSEAKHAEKHVMEWSPEPDNAYAPRVFATEDGAVGISAGGYVSVRTPKEWVRMAHGRHRDVDDLKAQLREAQQRASITSIMVDHVRELLGATSPNVRQRFMDALRLDIAALHEDKEQVTR